uniref:Uncharacterized protein n=1 Tax=Panagrolaimus sp. ES5 TaxID=591445 RepID=A0AC34GFS7_9BILA
MALLNFDKKYEFLATMARNLLLQRKNVRNLVAEFEAGLCRHADLIKRKISRLESQLSNVNSSKYSKIEKEIEAAKKEFYVCIEKAKDFEGIIQRDKITFQKLPDTNDASSRIMPDMDYQRRLIYEVFIN